MTDHQVDVQTRNMAMTDAIHDYVTGRAERLTRHLPQIEDVRVELTYLKSARNASDRFTAEITTRGKNLLLRAEERADDLHAAFDTALDKLDRQIERFKGKRNRARGDGRSAAEVAEQIVDDETGELTPLLAKRKKFTLYPMSEEEAIIQMRELGHENFFIFYNVESSKINVLYRRRNGSYGLIEPEIG
ncbi:MAG: ribosomal subunit interface protein [Anaerolineaceae bacterium]|jgi:putative sigma-54 modulation protein|nr:ribosome-associated translation inhibitor RaiA [Anaerolineae bacterium]MBL1172792.1 ribosome-associated translation inhibitor RaiA [Chloroflexota bacterium]MBV6464955.1 Ribosome hibernation promotion factor [Anaerolineales bacterium]MCE7904831.1 ribosome-associated translation inhibitor RaiA [Anaerolineae bacterium CFX3]MDL1926573.1 ribosome-associated translation inhibitor RaiA [Anaerolineae bacterium AMX1]OQY86366.1 MAG: ribosomal subunit interface protein [Anaerolineae bacterium UTCFX3]